MGGRKQLIGLGLLMAALSNFPMAFAQLGAGAAPPAGGSTSVGSSSPAVGGSSIGGSSGGAQSNVPQEGGSGSSSESGPSGGGAQSGSTTPGVTGSQGSQSQDAFFGNQRQQLGGAPVNLDTPGGDGGGTQGVDSGRGSQTGGTAGGSQKDQQTQGNQPTSSLGGTGQPVSTQVQTSYENAPAAGSGSSGGGGGGGDSSMDVNPAQYSAGPANIPQILGPVQTNYNHPNANKLVTQTRVIFSGGQAVKVTQPLVTEYNWGPSESGLASRSSSYARVIKHEKSSKKK